MLPFGACALLFGAGALLLGAGALLFLLPLPPPLLLLLEPPDGDFAASRLLADVGCFGESASASTVMLWHMSITAKIAAMRQLQLAMLGRPVQYRVAAAGVSVGPLAFLQTACLTVQ